MDKEEKLMIDCYIDLFNASTPKGDFRRMVYQAMDDPTVNKEATVEEMLDIASNKLEIPFNDHSLDEEEFMDIIDKHSKKLKPTWKRKRFKTSILLGCSPKTNYR